MRKKVWYANKNYQKKRNQRTEKETRLQITTITDQDEILEQQHDTPPSPYLDHQQ